MADIGSDQLAESKRQEGITPQMIISLAARLFQERGYRATSLEHVATALGVTRPALYYYFSSKERLLFAIHLNVANHLKETAEAILAEPLPTETKFLRMLVNHVERVAEKADWIGAFYDEEHELSAEHRAEIRQIRLNLTRILVVLYSQGVKEGVFRDTDPKLAVFTILGAINWLYRWYDPAGVWSPEDMSRGIVDILARGYLVRPGGK